MAYAVHLMANAVHPSEAPDVHNGIYAVHLCGKYSIPSEAPDLHDRICSTLDGKCSTPKWGSWSTAWPLKYMMANVVHSSVAHDVRWWRMQYTWWQIQYTQVSLLIYMMVSAVHDGKSSAPAGKCSTPKWGSWFSWWYMQYTCWQIQYTKWGS